MSESIIKALQADEYLLSIRSQDGEHERWMYWDHGQWIVREYNENTDVVNTLYEGEGTETAIATLTQSIVSTP